MALTDNPAPALHRLPDPAARPRLLFPLLVLLTGAGFLVGGWLRSLAPAGPVPGLTLRVESEPSGATVFLNGRLVGASPALLESLRAGNYVVRIEKAGHLPAIERVDLRHQGQRLRTRLQVLPVGRLLVAIEPQGAEVLLDGELVGHTPLTLTRTTAGIHELIVRKTNFETYTQRLDLKPDQELAFKYQLRDKILAMLRRQVESEPQRVGHYVSLGHYLFVQDKLEAAAEVYTEAIAVAATPMANPATMPFDEQALEERLRQQDVKRLYDDLRKKKNWPGKDVTAFRARVEKAQEQVAKEHVESWIWVKQAAENMMADQDFAQAEKLYLRHIESKPREVDLSQAYIALLDIRLKIRNLSAVRESFQLFLERYRNNPSCLRQAAHQISLAYTLYRGAERDEVLALAERMFRAAIEGTHSGGMKTMCCFQLANVLSSQNRNEEALKLYRQSIEDEAAPTAKEDRSYQMAACLVKLGRFEEARTVYERLAKSNREDIRAIAEQGMKLLETEEKARAGGK